ncbi:MAG: poly-beta-1,6 N-acetyl-D-glucosamine export porin PgaA [Thermodesulfobacteriota bacterium]
MTTWDYLTKRAALHLSVFFLFFLLVPASGKAGTTHQDAVALAREGGTTEAVQKLESLYRKDPADLALLSDLIVVLVWDEKKQKALELYNSRDIREFPEYVQTTVLDALRSLQRYDEGLKTLDYLLSLFPDNRAYIVRKARFLIDLDQMDRARSILEELAARSSKSDAYHRVLAYLHSSEGNYAAALKKYQFLLEQNPDDKEAIRGTVHSLQHMGAPGPALTMATASPHLFSREEKAALLALQGAVQLRWSGQTAKNRRESVFNSLHGLHLQLMALNLLDDNPESKEQARRIQYDMVVSLQQIGLADSAVQLYQELAQTGPLPSYVIQAAGDAELSRKQPAAARVLLKEALDREPDNFRCKISLFYASVEDEDFAAAYQLIDSLVQATPQFKIFQGSNHQYPNPPALDAAVSAALARLYGDQLDEAWQRINDLSSHAPAHSWIQQSTGDVALARGWPRQAEKRYKEALMLHRENGGATAGIAASHMQFHEFSAAESLLHHLQEQSPMERVTLTTLQDFDWQRRTSLWADLVLSNSEGPEQDGRGLITSAEIFSVPINDHIRINARGYYAWSEIPEGEESLLRYGGGLEYQNRFWSGAAAIHNNDSTVDEVGGILRAGFSPDDFWHFTLSGELFSISTPLRSLYYGISSDTIKASMDYRWSEQRQLAITFGSAWFSDNNERINANMSLSQRLLDIPHFDLDTIVSVYASKNSRDDAPYFNPASDISIEATLRGEHLLFRHYDNRITQRLEAGIGLYSQEGYEEDWTGHIRYEQRYAMSPRFEGVVGFELGRNVYDGEAESYNQLNLLLHVKL